MIKVYFLFSLIILGATKCYSQTSIYNLSAPVEKRADLSFDEARGKFVLIVILPNTATFKDSVFLARIDSVTRANSGKLITVAIPSIEDAFPYKDSVYAQKIKNYLNGSAIIALPMNTRKGIGNNQAKLFYWLTHSDQNSHFDYDVQGSGSMFIINKSGELVGSFGPEVMASNKVFRLMLK